MPVGNQMVFAAGPGPVDRRKSGVSPPLSARTCEPSIAASSMSSRPAARPAVPRAAAARRPLRSSPADAARLSHRCSRPVPRERPASSRPCTARRRCRAAQRGRLQAIARDTDTAWADEPAAAGPHVPTSHQAQDQRTPNRSCRHDTQLPSPTTHFILKRSVKEVAPGSTRTRREGRARAWVRQRAVPPLWGGRLSPRPPALAGPGSRTVPPVP